MSEARVPGLLKGYNKVFSILKPLLLTLVTNVVYVGK